MYEYYYLGACPNDADFDQVASLSWELPKR